MGGVLGCGKGIAVDVVLGDGTQDGEDVPDVGVRVAANFTPLGGRDRGVLGGILAALAAAFA